MARREETRTVQVPQTTTYSVLICDYCHVETSGGIVTKFGGYESYPAEWRRVLIETYFNGACALTHGLDYLDACGKCAIGIREGMAKRAGLAPPVTGDPK